MDKFLSSIKSVSDDKSTEAELIEEMRFTDDTMPNMILSHNNPRFQCNIAITNFLVSHTCEIRLHDVIGQSIVHIYFYAKILKHGLPTWPNEYVLDRFFLI